MILSSVGHPHGDWLRIFHFPIPKPSADSVPSLVKIRIHVMDIACQHTCRFANLTHGGGKVCLVNVAVSEVDHASGCFLFMYLTTTLRTFQIVVAGGSAGGLFKPFLLVEIGHVVGVVRVSGGLHLAFDDANFKAHTF